MQKYKNSYICTETKENLVSFEQSGNSDVVSIAQKILKTDVFKLLLLKMYKKHCSRWQRKLIKPNNALIPTVKLWVLVLVSLEKVFNQLFECRTRIVKIYQLCIIVSGVDNFVDTKLRFVVLCTPSTGAFCDKAQSFILDTI